MGEKARFVAGFAVFSFLFLSTSRPPEAVQEESDLQLLLPGAKEIEKGNQTLTAEQTAKIEQSIGGKLSAAEKDLTVFRCKAVPPDGGPTEAIRAVFLPLESPKDAWLGVASNAKGETLAVALIQAKSVDKSRGPFLAQFAGRWALRLTANSANAPAQFAEAQKKAQAGNTPEGKKIQALLRQKQLMMENEQWSDTVKEEIRSKDEKAVASAKEYAKVLAQLAEFAPKMSVLLEPAELKIYQDHFADMKKSGEAVNAALAKKEKDWDAANKGMRSIKNHCGKCHGWDTTHFAKPLESSMIGLREQLGVGQGYFLVGHDVNLPEGMKKEEAQSLAFAVKKALWVLQFSFAQGG